MAIGLIGRKAGMTRVFTEDGVSIPVTVIEVEPNRVTQLKTAAVDGYRALQVTTGTRRASHVNKPSAGHFAKANVEAGRGLWEFTLTEGEGGDITGRLGDGRPVEELVPPYRDCRIHHSYGVVAAVVL